MRAATESTTHILSWGVMKCRKSCGFVSVVCRTGGLMCAAMEPAILNFLDARRHVLHPAKLTVMSVGPVA